MVENACRSNWLDLPQDMRCAEIARCAADVAILGPRLNATVALTPVGQRAAGPLMGMPYVAKDMFDRAERRGEWGGCRSPGTAAADADILRRLDAAGGRQIAVAAMSVLAYEPSGHNAIRGRTRNPWHPGLVSGGSSSGSAALVAAGAARLGVGSDTGGSIRIPAACCGIVGLKPGWGSVPAGGAMPLAPSLDVIGFLARCAADLVPVWRAAADAAGEGAPIASLALLGDTLEGATPAVRGAVAQAADTLAAAGLRRRTVDGSAAIAAADAAALTIMQAEAARAHDHRTAPRGDAALARRLEKGLAITDADLAAALAARPGLRALFLESLGDCDAAVLPVLPMETPRAAEADPADPAFSPRTLYAMTSLTRFVNALGLPAIAVPVGFDDRGAPLAMQVVGRAGSETALLRLAVTFQQLTGWHARRPPASKVDHLEDRCV